MKTIGRIDFPECHDEAVQWKPTMRLRALHRGVLAVARTRVEGEWSCYVFPVAGKNHDDEKDAWRTEGCKQTADVARALFPAFDDIPYSR